MKRRYAPTATGAGGTIISGPDQGGARPARIGLTGALSFLALLLLGSSSSSQIPEWPPARLSDTGLYADPATKRIDPRHLAFSPQYALWSDGARKSRWASIPAGTWIDASDPERWEFPVGTRFWKEFRFSRRVETRLIERTPGGWQFAAYAWDAAESDAELVDQRGRKRSFEIQPGVWHGIPSRTDCLACHDAGAGPILGFTALQLSPDRDPLAPHAESPVAGGVDLGDLVARGLLRGLPPSLMASHPRVAAPTPVARAALGYLHANCGACHNDRGPLADLTFSLAYPLAAVGEVPALLTSVNRPSKFRVAGERAPVDRLRPADPDGSMILARMASRHPVVQMPPLGTRLVDREAVDLIRAWISTDLNATGAPSTSAKEQR